MGMQVSTEVVNWSEFLERFKWAQGEHITAIGHTGSGKTTLINQLLQLRQYVVFLATKKKDKTVDWLKKNEGFIEQKVFAPDLYLHRKGGTKIIVKPPFSSHPDTMLYEHHVEFRRVLTTAFVNGGWTVDVDELRYVAGMLKLANDLERIWLQGRALKVSLVGCTQTPKWIPTSAYSQCTHLFFWKDNDASNLKRLVEINSGHINPKELGKEIANLPLHDFIYLNTRTGELLRSRVEV